MKIRNRHRQETDRAAAIIPLSLLSPSVIAVPENIKSDISLAKFRDEGIDNFLGLGISARNCNNSDDQASNLLDKSVDDFGISSIRARPISALNPTKKLRAPESNKRLKWGDGFWSRFGSGLETNQSRVFEGCSNLFDKSVVKEIDGKADGGSSIRDRRIAAQTLIPGSNQDQARISALNPTKKRALDEFLVKEERAPESNKRLKCGDGFRPRFGFGLETSQGRVVFKRCSVLLKRLMSHKHSWVFNDPVDAKALGLPDYHDIVKHPMDLGTVNSNLSLNRYKSPSGFAEDVRLVFSNAMAYNPEGQDVHIMAQQLSEVFEEQWAAIITSSEFNSKSTSGRAPPQPHSGSAPRPKRVVARRKGRKPDEYPQPINPPEELVQLIGPNITPVFVYRKQLVESDMCKDQNRLFVNNREKLMDFMTEEERRAVEDDDKPGIRLIGIDRMGTEYELHSNKWGSLDVAVLKKEWHKIVVANRAKTGDWVHLWAYRRRPETCLFVDFREQP